MDVDLIIYVAMLLASGAMLLVLAAFGIGSRAFNGLVGLAAIGYAGYMLYEYFLTSDTFTMTRFIYAYVLPFFAAYQLYKGLKQRREAREAAANPIQNPYTLQQQPETPQS
jgi:hypothetical protein